MSDEPTALLPRVGGNWRGDAFRVRFQPDRRVQSSVRRATSGSGVRHAGKLIPTSTRLPDRLGTLSDN
jgi:hypothetical protein